MKKLILPIGIPGAGKSYYVKNVLLEKYPDALVVSTDNIRQELTGDASNQTKNNEVFGLAQKRTRGALNNNKTVIFDATNISRKDRRSLFGSLGNLKKNLDIEAHVILAPPDIAIDNQKKRDRKVPDYAIIRTMSRFNMPSKNEGFSEILYFNPWLTNNLLNELSKKSVGFDQYGKFHMEDLDQHVNMAVTYAKTHGATDLVLEALKYHDIGKLYTRTYDDNGNAHFYNHANASTYLYLCAKTNRFNISERNLYIASLIANHDMFLAKNFDVEKFRKINGNKLTDDLILMREADINGMISKDTCKKMGLQNFLNTFYRAEEKLSDKPFNINIKQKHDLILLKYTQFDSDMSFQSVKESRGAILFTDNARKYQYACRPFDKFFNYGEEYAAEIDWNSAWVTEKIDGSLCKLFYHNNEWCLATNGTIDAFEADAGEGNLTFGQIFERALGSNIKELGKNLDKNFTYMFELTSPETQVVIPYEDGVYYLSARDNKTGKEHFERPKFSENLNIKYPKTFKLNNIKDTINVVKNMSENEEGVVVCDKNSNRIKIKSPEYLALHKLRINGNPSIKSMLKYRKQEILDDIIAYNSNVKNKAEELEQNINSLKENMDKTWAYISSQNPATQKEFALMAVKTNFSDFLFKKHKDNSLTSTEYFNNLSVLQQARLLDASVKEPPKIIFETRPLQNMASISEGSADLSEPENDEEIEI